MTEKEQLLILEALLFASPESLTQTRMNLVFVDDLQIVINELHIFVNNV